MAVQSGSRVYDLRGGRERQPYRSGQSILAVVVERIEDGGLEVAQPADVTAVFGYIVERYKVEAYVERPFADTGGQTDTVVYLHVVGFTVVYPCREAEFRGHPRRVHTGLGTDFVNGFGTVLRLRCKTCGCGKQHEC